MAETFSTRGLKSLFSYPFRQPGWEGKLAVLAGLYLGGYFVPLLPWLVAAGYVGELVRRTAEGEGEPVLPDWHDWGGYLMDGLRLCGAVLIAAFPSILIFSCGFFPYILSMLALISVDSFGGNSGLLSPLLFGSWLILFASMIFGILITLGIGIPLPAALTHMLVKRSFKAVFQVKQWGKIFQANLGGFLIAMLLIWISTFMLQVVTQILVSTVILCLVAFILPIIAMPYISVVSAYLIGAVYREGAATVAQVNSTDLPDAEINPPLETI